MKLSSIFLFAIFLLPTIGWSQLAASKGPDPVEVEGYYQFPIRTGNQNYLSGTMGELRTNHFHAGIDIKTQGVQGLEVYATAGGYINRIKIATGGYGNALYILHPNGTTSVYAHLQKFSKPIADYVRMSQYQKESFEIELFPDKSQFIVKKGELIGYSGNSGSSGGPHLHFEIRDSQQRPVNPLKYKFPEIRDNIAPEVRKIALRTMDKSSRINGRYGRFEFQVLRNGSTYSIPVPITASGSIGVEILTHDKLNGANNRNGVPCMELTMDNQQAFQQNLETFTFAESRSILIHTDYQTARENGQRFVKMYVDTGNNLPFYETNNSMGMLRVLSDSTHKVQINLWDIYNNTSQVNFKITGQDPVHQINLPDYRNPKKIGYDLQGNDLVIEAPEDKDDPCAYVYSNRMRYQLEVAYRLNQTAVFIWDMDQGLPDSLIYGKEKLDFEYKAVMPGASSFNYYGDRVQIQAPKGALFDTVFLTYNYALDTVGKKEIFTISRDIYPIRKSISITCSPALKYLQKEQTSVYSLDNRGNPSYVGGSWNGEKITFKTRNWGTFTILADTVEPQVKALILNKDQLVFRIDDKLSGIKDYNLFLDGEWVLMNYDYKKKIIRSEKQYQQVPFEGALELKVTDNAGNVSTYRTNI